MYLKRLNVSGFKSFANKTMIDFVPGVTAVVGPNGSGKSNITEAIRWVLGEQSARSLRGSKMEDIIFSGSDARQAVNLAEVTLILDNSDHYLPPDYSELSVTRRVSRSGDSDYLLNGQPCRLKDIVDLFMDSGMGSEAYSVIGQGKIDEILNSKAEDRRRIFEEASGVLKYKLRKQAAEKQLDDSKDNLNRVEDILHELRQRLVPLEEQAAVAQDYLQKKENLQQIDVALLVHDIEKLHTDWENSKNKVKELEQDRSAIQQKLQQKSADLRQGRDELLGLEQDMDRLQKQSADLGELFEKLHGQKEVLAERRKHAQGTSIELKDRIGRMEEQYAAAEELLTQAQAAFRSEELKLSRLNKDLAAKEKEFSGFDQRLGQQLERLKSRTIEILNQQAALHNEKRYLSDQQKTLKEKQLRTASSTDSIQKAVREVREKKKRLVAENEETIGKRNQLRQRFSQAQEVLKNDRDDYGRQKTAIEKIDRIIEQAAARREMLEALQEDYAGFYQGVRQILKHKEQLTGIYGAVAELVQVEKKYQTAIETALGAAQQNIIVADEASGRQAIRFLRSHQAGRATFLPVSIMKSRRIADSELRKISGNAEFIGNADSLISCDPLYRLALEHLLGHIIITATLHGANQLAKMLNYRYRMVTLEGDAVAPGGAMTGGSVKQNQSGVLRRTSEIESLKKQIHEMQSKSSELKHHFSQLKNRLAGEELETEVLKNSLAAADESCRNLETTLSQIQAEERNNTEKYQLFSRENGDLIKDQEKNESRLAEIEQEIQDGSRKERELSDEIAHLTSLQKNKEAARDALQSEITALKVREARQSQLTLREKENQETYLHRAEELRESLAALKKTMQQVDTQIGDHEQSAEEVNLQAENVGRKKAETVQTLQKIRQAKSRKQQLLVEAEQGLQAIRSQHEQISSTLEQEKIALSRFDVQLDHLIDTLREEYSLTFEAAKENYPLSTDPERARKKVRLIKRSIEELGTVNVGAIEEYQTVHEREQFLSAQRDDLLKARATLENVMTEMDQEVIQRFSKTFVQIQGYFSTIFSELFGGGRASLQLLEPGDQLRSGIDILAEPPGKKLQKLSLLSGGERALTAIALLFAILKVRPVPFCVLDEVEAALDDANVDRYAQFLKKFSAETQFIVVTHRHGTMEHADVLYGVTMQESGISRLVSVRLEETEKLLSTGG